MRILSLTFGLIVVSGTPMQSQIAGLTTLHALQDHARPLLIFAPKPDDPRLEIQVRTLQEHAPEAHDRDLVPVGLPYQNPSPTETQLSAEEAVAVRRRFHVAPGDFAVILLGKDGGAKLRSDKPLPMQKLDATIDAMPMRKDEMRARQP